MSRLCIILGLCQVFSISFHLVLTTSLKGNGSLRKPSKYISDSRAKTQTAAVSPWEVWVPSYCVSVSPCLSLRLPWSIALLIFFLPPTNPLNLFAMEGPWIEIAKRAQVSLSVVLFPNSGRISRLATTGIQGKKTENPMCPWIRGGS